MRKRKFYQKGLNAERKNRGEFTRIVEEYRASDPEKHYGYLFD